MGKGTPCPMPYGNKTAIHARITQLRLSGADIHDIAPLIQDLWPGATANHVRGVVAGLVSRKTPLPTRDRGPPRAEPWRPGQPRPERQRT